MGIKQLGVYRPAAIGTTRALYQGVEFEKWKGGASDDVKDDDGNAENPDGGSGGDQNENPLG